MFPGKLIRILLGLCLWASVTAFAQQWAVSGASSVSEFYLRYSLEHYGALFSQCYYDKTCMAGVEDLAAELNRVRPFETAVLQFRSTAEMGSHLYHVDQTGRITVNRDLLYVARNGTLEPWTYSDALDFLTRIFGDRLGWDTGRSLRMAKHVSDYALYNSDHLAVPGSDLSQVALALIRRPVSALIIEDRGEASTSTIEVPFENLLSCGPSTGRETPMMALNVASAQWMPLASARDHVLLTIQGCLEYQCEIEVGQYRRFASNYSVQIDAYREREKWMLKSSSLRVRQDQIRPKITEDDGPTVGCESGKPDNGHPQ